MSRAERAPAGSGTRAAVARATWNGVLLAETSRPVLLEGNVYFPPRDVRRAHLAATRHRSLCAWKGPARYYTVRAGGQQNTNAAWYYPHPSPLARKIKTTSRSGTACRWTPARRRRPRRRGKRGAGAMPGLAPRRNDPRQAG